MSHNHIIIIIIIIIIITIIIIFVPFLVAITVDHRRGGIRTNHVTLSSEELGPVSVTPGTVWWWFFEGTRTLLKEPTSKAPREGWRATHATSSDGGGEAFSALIGSPGPPGCGCYVTGT